MAGGHGHNRLQWGMSFQNMQFPLWVIFQERMNHYILLCNCGSASAHQFCDWIWSGCTFLRLTGSECHTSQQNTWPLCKVWGRRKKSRQGTFATSTADQPWKLLGKEYRILVMNKEMKIKLLICFVLLWIWHSKTWRILSHNMVQGTRIRQHWPALSKDKFPNISSMILLFSSTLIPQEKLK